MLLMAGCAGIERAPQREAGPVTAPSTASASIEPAAAPSEPPSGPPGMAGKAQGAAAPAPMIPPAALSTPGPAIQGAAKPEPSISKAPTKVSPSPAPVVQLPKKDAPVPALAKSEAPPLDLNSLETRLKETKAIGVFTKLTLKNQVDDLLNAFRAFYQGKLKTTLAELRRSYDSLVLKVLALLQDADPPLANAIASSRESIWGILSNPAKFATI